MTTTPPAPGRAEGLVCDRGSGPEHHCQCLPCRLNRAASFLYAHGQLALRSACCEAEDALRRPAPAIVAEVGDTAKRVKIPADKFEIRWSGDPDVEVVLASDYDAVVRERDALRTCYDGLLETGNKILAERDALRVRVAEVGDVGELIAWWRKQSHLFRIDPGFPYNGIMNALRTLAEVRGERDALAMYADNVKDERDAATQRAEQAERELAATKFVGEFDYALTIGRIKSAFDPVDGTTLFDSYDDLRARLDVLRAAIDAALALPAPACDPATNATGSSHEKE